MKHRIIHLSCIAALALIAASIYHGKSSTAIAGHTEPGQIWMLDFLTPCWDSPNPPCLKLFPFSVISGGVGSMDGLDQWAKHDPLVEEHYRGFDIPKFQVVRLTDDRYQYVSYRKDNRIWWTKKRLKIPNGELLFTDGTNYARARCANRLSDKPMEPTSKGEPESFEILTPINSGDTPLPDTDYQELKAPLLSEITPVVGTLDWPITTRMVTRPTDQLESIYPPWETQPLPTWVALGSPLLARPAKSSKPVAPTQTIYPVAPIPTPEPASGWFVFIGSLVVLLVLGAAGGRK